MVRVSQCVENFEDGASRSAGCSRTPWGLVVVLVVGSAAADRAARDVVSALFVRIALRVIVVACVDDV